MDLSSGALLPSDVDEVEVGNRLVERYHSLWSALTDVDSFSPDEMGKSRSASTSSTVWVSTWMSWR